MRFLASTSTALALIAVLAAPAPAATVNDSNSSITYTAAAGESNQVTIARSGNLLVISDAGAAVTPLGTCAPVNANQAICPLPASGFLQAGLGDMVDTFSIAASVSGLPSTQVQGGPGNDKLTGGELTADNLLGEDGADELRGLGGNDRLSGGSGAGDLGDFSDGGAGRDFFDGSSGNDVNLGGTGDDSFATLTLADGSDVYDGGVGRDTISVQRVFANSITLDGQPGDGLPGENDNMIVEGVNTGPGNDTITGSNADESFSTGGGNDVVNAGGGNDNVFASEGADTSNGGPGDDTMFDSEGNDTLLGGDGNDEMAGGDGADNLNGQGGDDTYVSAFFDDEPDVFAGGDGIDRADYSGANGPVAVDPDGQADDGVAGERDNIGADVEDVLGSKFGDTLVGNDLSNELIGGQGNDVLRGAGGQDGLRGERGADDIDGGNGRDSLEGEDGADRIRSRDRVPDAISCGGASDVVLHDARDRPDADCDEVSSGVRFLTKRAPIRGRNAVVRLTCPEIEGIVCRGRLSLANARGRLIGRTRFAITPGRRVRVRVTLVPQARRARSQKVTGRAQMTDTAREQAITTARLTLFRR
jgi:Ca2+-binding RTX toxin-like protein